MKKLIPALVLLLVSAMVMSTASYAWFSMNRTVTTTGMQITATVPTQLLIKGSATAPLAVYKSAISFASGDDSAVHTFNTLTSVAPVAYKSSTAAAGTTVGTFYKLTEEANSSVKANGYLQNIFNATVAITEYTDFNSVKIGATDGPPAFKEATSHAVAPAKNDYISDSFTVKYAGEYKPEFGQLKVTVTAKTTAVVTAGTEATALTLANISKIYKAVHIVFVPDTTTMNDNVPKANGIDAAVYDIDLGAATIDIANSAVVGTTATVAFTANMELSAFNADNQEVTYTMYIFYDGEDADCINDNTIDMSGFSFELKFDLIPE